VGRTELVDRLLARWYVELLLPLPFDQRTLIDAGALARTDDALRSSVVAIEWFRDANQLGALYAPSQFAMWDLNTGQLLYRLSFTEEMVSFALDPFDHTQCCFMSLTGWITMATALGRSEPPVIHPAYRFNATNDTDTSASTPGAGTPGAPGGGGAAAAAQATPSRGGAGALSRSTAGAGQAPSAGAAGAAAGGAKSIVVSKVFHFQYYPCRRGIIFIVLAREIVVYDLTVKLVCARELLLLPASERSIQRTTSSSLTCECVDRCHDTA